MRDVSRTSIVHYQQTLIALLYSIAGWSFGCVYYTGSMYLIHPLDLNAVKILPVVVLAILSYDHKRLGYLARDVVHAPLVAVVFTTLFCHHQTHR
jgi:hypothetical protein